MLREIRTLVALCVVLTCLDQVQGHGRMIEPAARNCMWRYGYKTPRNYNDMGLNCGGFTNQFEQHRGQCGVCGDPIQGPSDHEAGGKYARGVVARQYQTGSLINITVELTSNHMGYFEFRLCPVNNPLKKATHACLDRHVLNIVGHGNRYFISRRDTSIISQIFVMLPPGLKCSQCVLQWKWVAGQSMGPDGYGGECLGCGNQEHFINCADIAIGTAPVQPLPTPAGGFKEPDPVAPPAAPYAKAAKASTYGPTYNVQQNSASATVAPQAADPNMVNILAQVFKMAANANRMMESQRQSQQAQPQQIRPQPVPQLLPKPQQPPQQVYRPTTASPAIRAPFTTTPLPWNAHQTWQQSANMWNPQSINPIPTPAQVPQASPIFNQNTAWNQNRLQAAQPTFNTNYNNQDYAGLEPGEYPEVETPSHNGQTHNNGNGFASASGSSYQQGFNDALIQLKQQLGLSGANNLHSGAMNKPHGSKINTALSEVSRTMQESQKTQMGGMSSMMCPGGSQRECYAAGTVAGNSDYDSWCTLACNTGECPLNMCSCMCPDGGGSWGAGMGADMGAGSGCRAVDRSKASSMDSWCVANCKQNNCPSDLCVCGYGYSS